MSDMDEEIADTLKSINTHIESKSNEGKQPINSLLAITDCSLFTVSKGAEFIVKNMENSEVENK